MLVTHRPAHASDGGNVDALLTTSTSSSSVSGAPFSSISSSPLPPMHLRPSSGTFVQSGSTAAGPSRLHPQTSAQHFQQLPPLKRRPAPSLFIPSKRNMEQVRIDALRARADGVEKSLRGVESVLDDLSALANLADGGQTLRERHAALSAQLAELRSHLLQTSPSRSYAPSSLWSAIQGFDTPMNGGSILPTSPVGSSGQPLGSPRSWTGGVVGLKRRLLEEQVDSPIAMSIGESLKRQADISQAEREAAARIALERLVLQPGIKSDAGFVPDGCIEAKLDFEGLSDDDMMDDVDDVDEFGTGSLHWGEQPDEERAWRVAEAAGYGR